VIEREASFPPPFEPFVEGRGVLELPAGPLEMPGDGPFVQPDRDGDLFCAQAFCEKPDDVLLDQR
jgi:hypothetical protein